MKWLALAGIVSVAGLLAQAMDHVDPNGEVWSIWHRWTQLGFAGVSLILFLILFLFGRFVLTRQMEVVQENTKTQDKVCSALEKLERAQDTQSHVFIAMKDNLLQRPCFAEVYREEVKRLRSQQIADSSSMGRSLLDEDDKEEKHG